MPVLIFNIIVTSGAAEEISWFLRWWWYFFFKVIYCRKPWSPDNETVVFWLQVVLNSKLVDGQAHVWMFINQSTNRLLWCSALCTKLTFLAAMVATAGTAVTAVTRSYSFIKECNRCVKSSQYLLQLLKEISFALLRFHYDICLHNIICSSTTIG